MADPRGRALAELLGLLLVAGAGAALIANASRSMTARLDALARKVAR